MTRYHHIVEIGAGDSWSSEGLRWGTHAKVTLWEPNIVLRHDLARAAAGMVNVTVRREAIANEAGERVLYHLGYASFLYAAPSFFATSVEEDYHRWLAPLARPVPCVTMREVDGGDIDLLILTCGGCEYDVLKRMVSRPQTIRTKHYLHNARQWAMADQSWRWLNDHGYVARMTDTNQHRTYLALEWVRAH